MAAGIQWEGEAPPRAGYDDHVAAEVFAMLSNGMGGIDWAGLPAAVAFIGVDDVELLVHRLNVIKRYKRPA